MKDALKWVLILGGGYVAWNLYQQYAAPAVAGTTPPAPPVPPTTPAPATVAPPATAPPAPPVGTVHGQALSDLATKVLALAGSNSLMADQWNYYWSKASGIKQTADLFPTGNRAAPMTFLEYLQARQGKSLGIAGLGARNTMLKAVPPRPVVRPTLMVLPFRASGGHPVNYVRPGTPMRRKR